MKNRIRIAALMVCVCVLMFGMNAFADSTEYNITVTKTGANEDNISKRTIRSAGEFIEFSVEPTYFDSNNAAFFASSIQLYGTASSRTIYVENGLGEERYGTYYNDYAPTDEYYFMKTSYGYSPTGSVNSKGIYTP